MREKRCAGLFAAVGGHEADVGEVAVALGEVHAVTDDEEVGDGEADVISFDFLDAAGRLVEECGDAQGFWLLLEEEFAQVREGESGVEDVFDDEDVFAFDGLVEVLEDFDCAGGALAFAIAGDGDEVEGGVDVDGA